MAKNVSKGRRRRRSGAKKNVVVRSVPGGRISQRRPTALLVLGMHRSGTSAFTRVLALLGADLPKNLMGATPMNEGGYWESNDLWEIHDQILESAGSAWYDWRKFNPDWYRSPAAGPLKQRLLELVRTDFGSSQLFVVKDPRICRFVPLWLDVLAALPADPVVIISVRNPVEVCASLKQRDGILPARSLLLWLRHVLDAESATRGLARAVASYETLMNDWPNLITKLSKRTHIAWPRRSAAIDNQIERFLAPRLRHHVTSLAELNAKSEIVDWVKITYAAMLQLAAQGENSAALRQLDEVREAFDKASSAFGSVLAEDELQLTHSRAEAVTLARDLTAARTLAEQSEAAAMKSSGELESAKVELSEHQTAIARLADDLSTSQNTLGEERNAREQAAAALANVRAESEQKEARFSAELTTARTQVTNLEAAFENLSTDLGQARAAIKAREHDIAQLANNLSASQNTLGEERNAREQAAAALVNVRAESEQKEARISAELTTARTQIADLEATVENLSSDLGQARAAVKAREQDIARFEHEIAVTRSSLRDTQTELQRLSGEVEFAKSAAAEAIEARKQIAVTLSETSRELSTARDELAVERLKAEQLEDLVKSLRDEFEATRVKLGDSSNEIERLKEEKNRLDAELLRVGSIVEQRNRALESAGRAAALNAFVTDDLRDTIVSHARILADIRQASKKSFGDRVRDLARQLFGGRTVEPYPWDWERNAILTSRLFDDAWYLQHNSDVAAAGIDPLSHYILYGAAEGRDPHALFDSKWYASQAHDLADSNLTPLGHYITIGVSKGLDPHPLFATDWYLKQNPDVAATHINPLYHFMSTGAASGLDPHPLFDTNWYLEKNPDVAATGHNPLLHYLGYGAAEGRAPHPLFDPAWYIEQCSSSDEARHNPLIHFLKTGATTRLSPHPLFDVSWYLENYPDVADSGDNPLLHYLCYGAADGRSPHPLFDGQQYLTNNPDVEKAGINPLVHYVQLGWREGRTPHPLFDPNWYLSRYPDVAAAGINPLRHYLSSGWVENRKPGPFFDTLWYRSKYGDEGQPSECPLCEYLSRPEFSDRTPHPLFDSAWYRASYGTEIGGVNPLVDYVSCGIELGRLPSPDFEQVVASLGIDWTSPRAVARAAFEQILSSDKRHGLVTKAKKPCRKVLDVHYEVWRAPPSLEGRTVCLFVSYIPDGRVSKSALHYMRALSREGIAVVLITASRNAGLPRERQDIDNASVGLIARENAGYDFACWALGIQVLPGIWKARTIIFANDSVCGPLTQASLTNLLRRIEVSEADYLGLTQSWQIKHHYQSYFFALKPGALSHPGVRYFWANLECVEDRDEAIERYEATMLHTMKSFGLRTEALFPLNDRDCEKNMNPTLDHWRELIDEGFPFIKVQTLRDDFSGANRSNWQADVKMDAELRQAIIERLASPEEVKRKTTIVRPGR